MGIMEAINKMDRQAREGICPPCKENRGETVELDEVKISKDGRTRVKASCPKCSFKTWRNHD